MKITILSAFALFVVLSSAEEIRLINLDPPEAQQYIDHQDTSLKYAPKVDSNVPAVRFLGNEPHHVLEDIYLANQYHGQDGLGGYLYGYAVPDIAKTEKKQAGGDLRGAYNYIAGNGQEIKVQYWDDGTGFHQVDNVPKILPKQIDDTPEVKAAKEEHARIWQEQAERNSHPIADPYDSHGNYAQGPLSPQAQQQFKQNQAQQLVNQYQQQKQQFPNPGQNVQYQGEPFGQFPQQTQNVNRYQQPGGVQTVAGQYSGVQSGQQSTGQAPSNPGLGSQQSSGQYTSGHVTGGQQTGGYGSGQAPSGGAYGGKLGGQYVGQHTSGQVTGSQPGGQQTGSYGSGQVPSGGAYGGKSGGQYEGQYQQAGSQTNSQYSSAQYAASGGNSENDGRYNEQEEEKGPPKGFFYSFDYPVGIIVQKDGGSIQKRQGDLNNIYSENKAEFERQLQQGHLDGSSSSSSSYSAVKN